jgi:diacylglycerol kinase (ATP)
LPVKVFDMSSSDSVSTRYERTATTSVGRGNRSWNSKFGHALHGMKLGIRAQSSFFGHFFVTAAVVATGITLNVSLLEWCLLSLSIVAVLAAEMFNSALEWLAQVTDAKHSKTLENALDISSAAVLLQTLGAIVVGLIVFSQRLAFLLQ